MTEGEPVDTSSRFSQWAAYLVFSTITFGSSLLVVRMFFAFRHFLCIYLGVVSLHLKSCPHFVSYIGTHQYGYEQSKPQAI
jgi:hypothetical protein